MKCVSCDRYMRVPPLVCMCFLPGVFLSSRVTGARPVTTNLIMRVSVRATSRRTRKIQSKKSPVEKDRFGLAKSDCVINGLMHHV